MEQIAQDAKDLCTAQNCDLEALRANLLLKGFDEKTINVALDKVRELNKARGIK